MFDTDNDNASAGRMVQSASGETYDLGNISGKLRKQLQQEGEISADSFGMPSNITGKKRAELIAARAAGGGTVETENTYQEGDLVQHRNFTTEVTKIDPEKGVRIRKKEGGFVWVHHSKVTKVEPKDD